MKKLLLFVLLAASFSACKKENTDATADFSYTQGANGMINFTNLSKNANSYSWNFGDGSSSTSFHTDHQYTANGNYNVTLSTKGAKTVTTTQFINVSNISTATTGQAIFWTATNTYGQIIVKVNGGNVGTLTQYSTNGLAPACGANGFVTIERPAGTYTITAQSADGNWTWSTTVVITNGQCTTKQFT